MGVTEQPADLSAPEAPRAGGLVDIQTRKPQKGGGRGSQVLINVTDLGRKLHNIEPHVSTTVVIYENGIWIPKNDR